MGTLTVNATNGQTVAAGASYTVPYPAGKSADDYLTTGAKITTSDGSIYSATVSLGASSITITNPTGREIASGGFDYLDLDNAGIVARFNSLGEGDVLLGPKNTEASLVSSENNLLTGKRIYLAGGIDITDEVVGTSPPDLAPKILPHDYLRDVRLFCVTRDYLFGVATSTPNVVTKYTRDTYTASTVYDFTALANGSIGLIVAQNDSTLWVSIGGGGSTNAIVQRLVSSDNWATTSAPDKSLYMGGDNINASTANIMDNGSSLWGYIPLQSTAIAFTASGDVYVSEYNANTQATAWQPSNNFSVGAFVHPTTPNGYIYKATADAGSSGGAEPTWPTTLGATVVDSGITWTCASIGSNIRMRVLKLAAGSSTWTAAWTLNSGLYSNCRHIHMVQVSPYTGAVWISAGDSDEWNDGAPRSASNTGPESHCWTVVWDGVTPLPNNPSPATMKATVGMKCIGFEQRHRLTGVVFVEGGAYAWSDSGFANPAIHSGIYYISDDLTTFRRVYSETIQGQNTSGYLGIKTNTGRMAFFASATVSATYTERQVGVITGNADGTDWAWSGAVTRTDAGTSLQSAVVYDPVSDLIFASWSDMPGKGTASVRQTAIARIYDSLPHNLLAWDGNKIIRPPETLHPVYWCAATGVDDAAAGRGFSPRLPWLTPEYACASSRMTSGGRLVVGYASYTTTSQVASANWSANANPGAPSLPLEIDTRNCVFRVGTNGGWLTWTATQHLRWLGNVGMTVAPGSNAGVVDFRSVAADCNVEFNDGAIGMLDRAIGSNYLYLVSAGRGTVTFNRSRATGGAVAALIVTQVAAGAATKLIINDSAVDDFSRVIVDYRLDLDVEFNNSFVSGRLMLMGFANAGVWAGKFKARKSAMVSASGVLMAVVGGGALPTAFATPPYKDSVLAGTLGVAITTPDQWDQSVVRSTELTSAITVFQPLEPADGDWRDEAFPLVGPRTLISADDWLNS